MTKTPFMKFLEAYLENVKRELPTCYRAKQLEAGGMEAMLVYEFETRFLKEPFEKALEEQKMTQIKNLKIVLEFVERHNKFDKEQDVAQAAADLTPLAYG